MAIYVVYDPADGNKIKRWIQCLPEEVTWQKLFGSERIAWINRSPPTLGFVEKIFNPETREISDGEKIPTSD